jgi:hypothetical protein
VPTADDYAKAGLPWFKIYDEGKVAVSASTVLSGLDCVAALGMKKGESPLPQNTPLSQAPVVQQIKKIREGGF